MVVSVKASECKRTSPYLGDFLTWSWASERDLSEVAHVFRWAYTSQLEDTFLDTVAGVEVLLAD